MSFSPSTIAAAAVILAAGEGADVPEMFYERVNKVKFIIVVLYFYICIRILLYMYVRIFLYVHGH